MVSRLEAAGRRRTAQREAVCRALVDQGGHPTVAEIYERVHRRFPMMSRATVYNTVDALRKLGVIVRLDATHRGHAHYDLDTRPHVNILCRSCGATTDVATERVDEMIGEVEAVSGYSMEREAGLTAYGTCARCFRRAGRGEEG